MTLHALLDRQGAQCRRSKRSRWLPATRGCMHGHVCRLCSVLLSIVLLVGCAAVEPAERSGGATTAGGANADGQDEAHHAADPGHHELAELDAVDVPDGELLQVVASTNIVADVVAQVGGEHIDLVGLMPVGADPHGFEPTPHR